MFNLFKNNEPIIFSNVSAQEVKNLLQEKKDTVILDVRTAVEVEAGKINGAKNIDFMRGDFEKQIKDLDKSKTYLLYCRTGYRSAQAANKMASMGFSNLYNLKGGISSWPYEQTNA